MIDYHIHTIFSDGSGQHEEYIRQAVQSGLSEIGFSDHLCLRPVSWAVSPENIPKMSELVQHTKSGSPNCRVKFGIEVDYFPDQEAEISQLIDSLPVDYVIGSVHFLGHWNMDNSADGYSEWNIGNLYEYYFSVVSKAARSGLFDILGHVDLVKKFGHRPEGGSAGYYGELIRAISESGVAVELNCSGMNKPCREFYPTRKFLELCRAENIPVTLGSDAHNPGQVGQHFPEALKLLKAVGYDTICKFDRRNRTEINI